MMKRILALLDELNINATSFTTDEFVQTFYETAKTIWYVNMRGKQVRWNVDIIRNTLGLELIPITQLMEKGGMTLPACPYEDAQ